MRIKVISLSSSIRRRDTVTEQLGKLNAPFEFADAIRPDAALQHIHHYDEHEFLLNCGRPATATEIARYASHLALWRQCSDGNDPYLILEDDVELDAAFLAGLLVVASQIRNRGLICISSPEVDNALPIDDLGRFKIQYCRRVPLPALGYAISPKAAARLAMAGQIVEEPVDQYMQRFWRHRQPVYGVYPPIVRLAAVSQEPRISERHPPRYGFSTWIRRAARKTDDTIARTRFNISYSFDVLQSD